MMENKNKKVPVAVNHYIDTRLVSTFFMFNKSLLVTLGVSGTPSVLLSSAIYNILFVD